MKCLKVCVLLIVAWSAPDLAHAQSNPPFQSPALDSNCYFPQIGVTGEIDTIYGSMSGQGLGTFIHNLGRKPDGTPGNMLLGSTGPYNSLQEPTDIFLTAATGPNFNLHNLKAKAQKFLPDITSLRFGHFHNQSNVDIFDAHNWIIYWADENGDYDSTRFTKLKSNILGNEGVGILGSGGMGFIPYIAHLSSDTVDDIVLGYGTFNDSDSKDSLFLILFKGGSDLASASIKYEDTSANFGQVDRNHVYQSCVQGDFRGTGREDLLMSDQQRTLFFFPNNSPFRLSELANAMMFDTLWTRTANTEWGDNNLYWPDPHETLTMHALPKKTGDSSYDWAVSIPTMDDSNNAIFIFRGGPDFGSHRFTLDSAAFVINAPEIFASETWPEAIADAGDMTGTGNHVLYTSARNDVGDYWWDAFFVTGKALDDKIDIYNSHPYSEWPGDTLTANSDSLEDYLFGLAWPNAPNGPTGAGALWLYYGSKQIPVHLNPQFADVKTKIDEVPKKDGAGITLSPNPANNWTVATIVWPDAEEGEYIITDMLGREVQRDQIQFLGGGQENRISFPELPQGAYAVTLVGQHGTATARMIKLATASVPQSGTSRSFMQSLHDAAQGNVSKFPGAAPLLR